MRWRHCPFASARPSSSITGWTYRSRRLPKPWAVAKAPPEPIWRARGRHCTEPWGVRSMQHDERVRTLLERGLSSGPAAQPHPDDLLSRLRRRRIRRRVLNSAVVVVVAAGVLVPILMLKGMGHPPAQSLGGRVGGYGISLRLPSGWHA